GGDRRGGVLGNDLDATHDVPVELVELFCRDPVLLMLRQAHLMDLKLREVVRLDGKARHIAALAIPCIPIARDLAGIRFEEHGIENRLPEAARREAVKVALTDQGQLVLAGGAREDGRLRLLWLLCLWCHARSLSQHTIHITWMERRWRPRCGF